MTDNKDPQITADNTTVEKYLQGSCKYTLEGVVEPYVIDLIERDYAAYRIITQLAAELKQLRADNQMLQKQNAAYATYKAAVDDIDNQCEAINRKKLSHYSQLEIKAKNFDAALESERQMNYELTLELEQLRTERAGLLVWIDEHIELADEIMTQDEKDLLIEIKSKLTDSAQSGEGE